MYSYHHQLYKISGLDKSAAKLPASVLSNTSPFWRCRVQFGWSYWKRSWKASPKGNEEVAMDNWLPSHGWLWIWIVWNSGTHWWVRLDFFTTCISLIMCQLFSIILIAGNLQQWALLKNCNDDLFAFRLWYSYNFHCMERIGPVSWTWGLSSVQSISGIMPLMMSNCICLLLSFAIHLLCQSFFSMFGTH